jgi:hypothetical protein
MASMRARALSAALAVLLTLTLAAPAQGAGDPVKSGQLRLQLSDAFKQRLAKRGIGVSPKSFALGGGTVDPIAGTGSLQLRGKLRFRRSGEKAVFRDLGATVGPGGLLRSGRKPLFALSGGVVTREGFGARITGVQIRLLRGATRSLKRSLGVKRLRPGYAGSASVTQQPATVQVLTGTATLAPDTSPGSVNSKLAAHCIDSSAGISPIAPATQPGGAGTPYFFPVSGGTVSPTGIEGVVQQVGGFQLQDGGSGLPAGCPSSPTVTIRQTDLAVDFLTKNISALLDVSGSGVPFGLQGIIPVSFPYDSLNATFTADPVSHTVTSGGTVIRLNSLAAYYLNQAFPQPSGGFDPAMEFAAGDSYGTAGLTLQVR